ncbi:hypothetical protein ACHAPT_005861 [Fusarium lateritium]
MAEPMEEDPPQQVGEGGASRDTRAETTTSTIDVALIRRRKKLLETIALIFHFDFQALPNEAQEAYWRFREDRGFTRFAVDLQHMLLNHTLDEFLHQCAAFLLAAAELFGEKHPQLGLRELCQAQRLAPEDEAPPDARPSAFGVSYLSSAYTEDIDDPSEQSRPSARLSRAITRTTQVLPPGTMGPQSHGSIRLVAGPSTQAPASGEEASSNQDPELEQTTMNKPLIPGFTISTRRTPPLTSSEQDTAAPGRQTREADDGPPRDIRSRQEYNSGWLRNFAGDRGIPPPDFNMYPYKGWKIEPPLLMLRRAKNFLADEDVDRTIEWDRKFAELAEYFSYLLHNWKGERWGADLHEAIDMLHTHRLYEDYHYGKPKLKLDFPTTWSLHAQRLPRLPGRGIVLEDDVEDMGQRKLLYNPIRAAHDVHYEMPSDVLKKYVDEYAQDARYFWSSNAIEPRQERLTDADPNNRRFNMVQCENTAYEKSILKNMQETCSQLESQPRPPAKLLQDKPDINSLRQFASFRGTRRAALQQCLSQFSNVENEAVCNQWRALILPPPPKKREQPDAGVLFTTMQVAEVPEEEARDPFGYTLAHNWFNKAQRYWGEWDRSHSIKEAYGQKRWARREEPVMDLPINFKGPYVLDYMDTEMKKTQALLYRCQIIWERLVDKEQYVNREFLTKMVKCVWQGLNSGEGAYLEQGSLIQADGDTPVPHIRPLEEDLLRFVTGPSVNAAMFGIKQGADADESEDEELPPTSNSDARIFEERVDEMLNDISRDSFFHPMAGPRSRDFMTVLNRDCDGPMKRYRFSREEATKYALILKKKGKIYANKDLVIRRPKVDFHPEERIRWLDSDYDVEPPAEPPAEPKDKAPVEVQDDEDASTNVSTIVTVPESVDLGLYAVGLPRLANIRSWVSTIHDRQSVSIDMEKTLILFEGLGYRLGRTISELRKKYSRGLSQLTPEQRENNRYFIRSLIQCWELDIPRRANDCEINPNAVGSQWEHNRITPMYRDAIQMVEPEAYDEEWGGMSIGDEWRYETMMMVSRGVIREAYENKSMLFPTRVTRSLDDLGKAVPSAPRREPVWSFGHPQRCGQGPRFWDIDRWPLHLQTDETRELIENSGNDDSVCVVPPSRGGKPLKRAKRRTKRPKTEEQLDNIMETIEEEEKGFHGPKGKERARYYTGEPFIISYADRAQTRRHFKPGVPEYWMGDTPLQKKRIEERIKSGLVETGPSRTWRQRLADFLGAKVDDPADDDPTALPYVHPWDIPKSKPRPEERDSPELPCVDPEDVPRSRSREDLTPSEVTPESTPQSERADSPVDFDFDQDEDTEDAGEDGSLEGTDSEHEPPSAIPTFPPPPTPATPSIPTEAVQGESSSAPEQAADLLSTVPGRRRQRRSRPFDSHRLELEIIEPEEDSERPPRDEEDEALYRALHQEFYDSYGSRGSHGSH